MKDKYDLIYIGDEGKRQVLVAGVTKEKAEQSKQIWIDEFGDNPGDYLVEKSG